MSTSPYAIDPEVEAILQEVARDPRSSLLRIERPRMLRGLLERDPGTVGVATAGLTTAERHLVQTRRAETAFALRVLCLATIFEDPRAEHLLSRQGAANERELAAALASFRRGWVADETEYKNALGSDAHVAQAVLGKTKAGSIDVLHLIGAAQRLEPTDLGKLYAAGWLLLEGQPGSSIGLLRNVMSLPNEPLMRAAVSTNLGLAYHRLERYEESLAWYRKASEEMGSYVPGVVGRLVIAIQIGVREEAEVAGHILDELYEPSAPEILWQCQSEGARRSQFQAKLTVPGRDLLRRIGERLGTTSKALVHALE